MRKKAFPDPAKPPNTLMSFFCFLRAFWRAIKSRWGLGGSRKCSDPYFPCPQRQQRHQSGFRGSEGTLDSNVVCSLGLSSLWMLSRSQLSGFGGSEGTLIGFWESESTLGLRCCLLIRSQLPWDAPGDKWNCSFRTSSSLQLVIVCWTCIVDISCGRTFRSWLSGCVSKAFSQ